MVKKIKLPCTVLAKQDTVVLQVLHVFLAPVASVQSESFSALHSGAKSSPEVERERGSPCCGALLPPPPSSTAPPPHPPSIANVAHSSLALLVRWNSPGDIHFPRLK